MKQRIPISIAVVLAVSTAGWLFWSHSGVVPAKVTRDPQIVEPPAETAAYARPDAPRVSAANVDALLDERSPLADALNRPGGTAAEDLHIVEQVLRNFEAATGFLPSGNNREITAALSGRNERGLAPLPAGHPAISPEGELLDRWGRAFIFHPVSRHVVEVRTRGADGVAYSSDDEMIATGAVPSQLAGQD